MMKQGRLSANSIGRALTDPITKTNKISQPHSSFSRPAQIWNMADSYGPNIDKVLSQEAFNLQIT